MNKRKKLLVLTIIILSFLSLFKLNTSIAYAKTTSDETLYSNSTFNIQGDKLNLIINSISKDNKFLIIDTYLFNNSPTSINSIKDFILNLNDSNNSNVLDEIFPIIPITDTLKEHNGVKLILSIPLEHVNLKNKDFASINYKFTYNFT